MLQPIVEITVITAIVWCICKWSRTITSLVGCFVVSTVFVACCSVSFDPGFGLVAGALILFAILHHRLKADPVTAILTPLVLLLVHIGFETLSARVGSLFEG